MSTESTTAPKSTKSYLHTTNASFAATKNYAASNSIDGTKTSYYSQAMR